MSSSLGKSIITVVLVLLGVVWVAVIVILLHAIGTTSPGFPAQPAAAAGAPTAAPNLPSKHYALTLQTFPNTPEEGWMAEHHYSFVKPAVGSPYTAEDTDEWVRYGPNTNLVLPAHALITMTIENYDSATPILNNFYAQAQGTVGGTETVNGKTVSSVDPGTVSHTFTIHSIPDTTQDWLYVSVPVVGVADNAPTPDFDFPAHPVVMQFSFVTGGPGNYIWQCFDPCGYGYDGFGGPMQTRGFMSGTVTVQ